MVDSLFQRVKITSYISQTMRFSWEIWNKDDINVQNKATTFIIVSDSENSMTIYIVFTVSHDLIYLILLKTSEQMSLSIVDR